MHSVYCIKLHVCFSYLFNSKWVLVTGTVQYTYSRILVTGFAFIGKVASFLLKQYDIGEGNISQLLQEVTAWYFDNVKIASNN